MIEREKLPYRQSTLAFVCDDEGCYLLVQKNSYSDDQWSFPGGGVDTGETPEDAVTREMKEELESEKFEIVARSKVPYTYEWSDEVIGDRIKTKNEYFRGQSLVQFLMKYTGDKADLKPGDGIRKIEWVKRDNLKSYLVFPDQWENAEKTIASFLVD